MCIYISYVYVYSIYFSVCVFVYTIDTDRFIYKSQQVNVSLY